MSLPSHSYSLLTCLVGSVAIPLSVLRDKEEKREWYPIVLKEKAKEQATLYVSLLVDSKVYIFFYLCIYFVLTYLLYL